MDPESLIVRRAEAADTAAVADVWLRSFAAALPTVRKVHSDEAVRAWIERAIVPGPETWVAVVRETAVGLLALQPGWVDQLYLDPNWRGRGIGARLIDLAKKQHPTGLQLWTFQVNESACRFYERHGFVAVERTDGSHNEEQEPDVRYQWHPGLERVGADTLAG